MAKSIVRVGPDGSASVVINTSGGILVGGTNRNNIQRNRKYNKKEVMTKAMSIGDLSAKTNCAKCDRGEVKYHGIKCLRSKGHNFDDDEEHYSAEVSRLRGELAKLNADLDRARQQIVALQLEQDQFER